MNIITLTTDFGDSDSYVGAIKGVILSINPIATIVDVTHVVPPQDIRTGAFALMGAAPYFPKGTVHVAVVDPGVGSARRPIAIKAFGHYFVGPDNGVLTLALQENLWRRGPTLIRPGSLAINAVQLTNRRFWLPDVSQTFHGRDIFAPIAAHLSSGVPLEILGEPIADYVTLKLKAPREQQGILSGEIIYIDRFGNVISNIPDGQLSERNAVWIEVGERTIKSIRATYAEAAKGELLALISSSGFLELAVRDGNAAQRLGAKVGDEIRVRKQ